MGGTALSKRGVHTRRVDRKEYFEISNEVTSILGRQWFLSANVIPSYLEKESFGDLDVLIPIDTKNLDLSKVRDLAALIATSFKSNAFVQNGNIVSLDYKDFQVDLIFCPLTEFSYTLNYFSWNDLGNFVGRVAHRLGFKHGHDGLWYVLRDPNNHDRVIEEILVTRDYNLALEFLGYPSGFSATSFKTKEDVFDYAMRSHYFDPASFLLGNRSYSVRVRDKKRAMHSGMLEYIKQIFPDLTEDSKPVEVNKAFHLNRAFDFFHGQNFEHRFMDALEKFNRVEALKKKFNGDTVFLACGKSGKELGAVMTKLREIFDEYKLQDFVTALEEKDAISFFKLLIDANFKNENTK